MSSVSSTLKACHLNIQSIIQQPYVYSYRIKLSLTKHGFAKQLVKIYVDYTLKSAQNKVDKLNCLSIESIISDPFLSKHHFTLLYALCRFLKPHTVVEAGVGLGVSSLFILRALQDNGFGELYSIDYPGSAYRSDAGITINENAYISHNDAPGCLIPDDLRDNWTLVLGKSRDQLPKLCERLTVIDLFFHDSEHTYQNMLWEYETVWPYIRNKGILASHDVDWNNAFRDFTQKNSCISVISRNSFGFIVH